MVFSEDEPGDSAPGSGGQTSTRSEDRDHADRSSVDVGDVNDDDVDGCHPGLEHSRMVLLLVPRPERIRPEIDEAISDGALCFGVRIACFPIGESSM